MKAFIVIIVSILLNSSLVTEINDHRNSLNLSNLKEDRELSQLAYEHSVYMENQGKLSHDNFNERSKGRTLGECTSKGNINHVQAWLKSPEHKKIIEGNYSKIGVGIKGEYATIILEK
jgi:uncharacterized protein YkwD